MFSHLFPSIFFLCVLFSANIMRRDILSICITNWPRILRARYVDGNIYELKTKWGGSWFWAASWYCASTFTNTRVLYTQTIGNKWETVSQKSLACFSVRNFRAIFCCFLYYTIASRGLFVIYDFYCFYCAAIVHCGWRFHNCCCLACCCYYTLLQFTIYIIRTTSTKITK